jgi:hypothetical protein
MPQLVDLDGPVEARVLPQCPGTEGDFGTLPENDVGVLTRQETPRDAKTRTRTITNRWRCLAISSCRPVWSRCSRGCSTARVASLARLDRGALGCAHLSGVLAVSVAKRPVCTHFAQIDAEQSVAPHRSQLWAFTASGKSASSWVWHLSQRQAGA